VGRHDAEHLRRFVHARANQDAAEMRRWWGELVVDFHDRMDGLVAAAHKGRLDDEEHELAVQLALIRFAQRLIGTFHGVSNGQLVNATLRLAEFACMDVQRQAIARRGPAEVSLDDGWDAEDGRGGPAWEHAAARRAFEDEEAARDTVEFIAWALPQVTDSRRRVLELTFEGAQLQEICAELDISDTNAYQRRSRGLKDLSQLKERYDA
jgi:DNA-directed RNA polymerase specialized sigma24 family protein